MSENNILADTVRISGFRGISNLEVSLSRITLLIGCNNSGKTSLLKALQLALGDYFRYVSEEDFHIDETDKKVSEILVDVRIIPLDKSGSRTAKFEDEWVHVFGDKIQSEANGNQFLVIRVRAKPNEIKGGFDVLRFTLDRWPEFSTWKTDRVKEKPLTNRFSSVPFIPIEAQRDIHHELKERNSFAGRILSSVEYNQTDIDSIEGLIKTVNEDAVKKSPKLTSYKKSLGELHKSFQGSGNVEITPFPKKVRDLSKHFSVHFGETAKSVFSMEYHGMGTRSWASILTLKAFIGFMSDKHEEEVEAFFPIVSAEEPEAHLHPNAQKTLYQQLSDSQGQIIISTHSPYLAAMAKQEELRCLIKSGNGINVHTITNLPDPEDRRKLQREIIHSRGEILFSRAIVLCEGETEEQALPILFSKYFGQEAFTLGINFIGVGGAGKYLPFLRFGKDFNIPVFVFSDGEPSTIKDLGKHYSSVFGATDITKSPNITILPNSDFEDYLIKSGFSKQVEDAIIMADGATAIADWMTTRQGRSKGRVKSASTCTTCTQPIYTELIRDYSAAGGKEIAMKEILYSSKPKYAPLVSDEICKLDVRSFPPKVIEFFENIKKGAGV